MNYVMGIFIRNFPKVVSVTSSIFSVMVLKVKLLINNNFAKFYISLSRIYRNSPSINVNYYT